MMEKKIEKFPNCEFCNRPIPRDVFTLEIVLSHPDSNRYTGDRIRVDSMKRTAHWPCAQRAFLKIKDALAEVEDMLMQRD